MSFYMTLPSTASSIQMPDNKQTNFTVLFNPAIDLKEPYEVALTEITHSTRFLVNLGDLVINNPFYLHDDENIGRIEKFKIELSTFNGERTEVFIEKLNAEIRQKIIMAEYNFRKLLAAEKHKMFASKFADFYQSQFMEKEKGEAPKLFVLVEGDQCEIIDKEDGLFADIFKDLKLKYNKTSQSYMFKSSANIDFSKHFIVTFLHLPIVSSPEYRIEEYYAHDIKSTRFPTNVTHSLIYQKLNLLTKHFPIFAYGNGKLTILYDSFKPYKLTGLATAVFTSFAHEIETTTTLSYAMTDSLNIINNAQILTDIIEDQYYGDVMSPVLYTINLKSSAYIDSVTSYENPHYLPVNKSVINSINIRILDLSGEPVKFSDIFSIVIIKLHFRRRNE